jgi:selenocysteine lyase/cysteine desulfurase
MSTSRREFLFTAGAAAVATLAPSRLLAAVEKHTPPPADVTSWTSIRAQFPLDPSLFHFSSFFLASHPKPVRDAIEGFRRALDANPYITVEHALMEPGDAYPILAVTREVATYLGGKPEEVCLTPNTTTGLALIYTGLPVRSGDEVVTTTHDHYVHHESIRLATLKTGASMRKVPLFSESAQASTAEIVRRVREAIGPKTRVVGVTWVQSSNGVRLPIREIAAAVADANRGRGASERVLLVVDGVHGLGCSNDMVADLGCDFFSAGTHKWMFAPRGTGIVWARAEQWALLRPTIPSFSAPAFSAWMEGQDPPATATADLVSPGGFVAFEHQWGMRAAFQFHQRIGRERVAARIRDLNIQCKKGLAAIPGVRLHTPMDPALSAGLVCFEVNGAKPDDVVKKLLDRKIVASSSPYQVSYVRLAPSLVNSPEEVDTALRAVRAITT